MFHLEGNFFVTVLICGSLFCTEAFNLFGIHDLKRKVVWNNSNQNTLPLSCPTDYNNKSKILPVKTTQK